MSPTPVVPEREMIHSYAKSTTSSNSYTLSRGNQSAGDDVQVGAGSTWCSIVSTEEGQTKVVAYCPAIQNWDNHKAYAVKNWSDMAWAG